MRQLIGACTARWGTHSPLQRHFGFTVHQVLGALVFGAPQIGVGDQGVRPSTNDILTDSMIQWETLDSGCIRARHKESEKLISPDFITKSILHSDDCSMSGDHKPHRLQSSIFPHEPAQTDSGNANNRNSRQIAPALGDCTRRCGCQ